MIKDSTSDKFIIVDAGVKGYAKQIIEMAHELFGEHAVPSAIILTHAHFDHVGSLKGILEKWDVGVFVHQLEIPYVTGLSSYPAPDPTVGGGLMSSLAWALPTSPIDISANVKELNRDGKVPFMNEWNFIHTPGHTPGHISLYRKRDKVLIAGDAFVTTQQESVFSNLTQKKKVCGPPKYFTTDWDAAFHSVQQLSNLYPEIAATGHGKPIQGQELTYELEHLAAYFYEEAVPSSGRYVPEPAKANRYGVTYVPPANKLGLLRMGATVALGFTAAYFFVKEMNKRRNS